MGEKKFVPLVSIVVPVYNVENYVEECLRSIISQTYSRLEIIIVNDGSEDGSLKKCEKIAAVDSRIKIFSKKNGGLSSARNYGMKCMHGEFVSFVDSDDIIAVDMIETMVNMIVKFKSDIAVVGISPNIYDLKKKDNFIEKVCLPEKAIKELLIDGEVVTSASGKLYKSELWNKIEFPEGRIFEDYATIYKVIDRANVISVSQNSKYYYRTNPNGITQSAFNKKKMDYFISTKEIREYVLENYPKYIDLLDSRTCRYAISFFRNAASSGFIDASVLEILIAEVRNNIIKYLKTKFSIFSKLYGICISISPPIAFLLFRRT